MARHFVVVAMNAFNHLTTETVLTVEERRSPGSYIGS